MSKGMNVSPGKEHGILSVYSSLCSRTQGFVPLDCEGAKSDVLAVFWCSWSQLKDPIAELVFTRGAARMLEKDCARLCMCLRSLSESLYIFILQHCPGVVSCADVLALVARDAIVSHCKGLEHDPSLNSSFLSWWVEGGGRAARGPFWKVPTGRRERDNFKNLRGLEQHTTSNQQLHQSTKTFLLTQGLNLKDLVAISAHTILTQHLDSEYAPISRQGSCRSLNDNTTIAEMDPGSFRTFDLSYYRLLLKRRGLFQSDSALTTNSTTLSLVNRLLRGSLENFFAEFAKSMEKMGRINVKTGTVGEIRKQCAVIVEPNSSKANTATSLEPALLVGQGSKHEWFFYSRSCPNAEKIVQDYVNRHIHNAPSVAATIIRMHFHDCFVRGCDASLLLNTTSSGNQTEKLATPNLTLRQFDFIDRVKSLLEAACPGVVSCADVLALVARDAIVATGGPFWKVPTGRRDGTISRSSEALNNIPPPTSNFTNLQRLFANQGLNLKDLVVLSGAHTIGIAHCQSFSNRLYNFTGIGDEDPALDSEYAANLKARKCKSISDNTTIVEMDPGSRKTFDLSYYKLLLKRRGLFQSDASLTTNSNTSSMIRQILQGSIDFRSEFSKSMEKMGRIRVKTGSNGEIRRQCALVNS
ncbi:hypothetical protein D5086_030196 [Populus alba]|uniref:Uncharacterized protein n=1 Tax=Populus alba TaxID=43335 RepID=A0ACC4AN05_POPAL